MSYRALILAFTALGLSFPAVAAEVGGAQGSLSAPMPRLRRTLSPNLLQGWSIGGGVLSYNQKSNLSRTIDLSNFGMGLGSMTEKIQDKSSSDAAPAFVANYSWIRRLGLGFTSDVTVSQTKQLVTDESYVYVRPTANVAVGGARWFYGYAGVNLMSFISQAAGKQGTEMEGVTIETKPQLGWQAGVGAAYGMFQGQLQYSTSRVTVDTTTSPTSGLLKNMNLHYEGAYDFSGVELIAMYRF